MWPVVEKVLASYGFVPQFYGKVGESLSVLSVFG